MSAGAAARTRACLWLPACGGALLLCALRWARFACSASRRSTSGRCRSLSLAVLAWLVDAAPPARAHAAALGFCFGLGYFLTGVSWVYVSMHEFGGMAVPLAAFATLFFCAIWPCFQPAAAWIAASHSRAHAACACTLVFPAVWALTEWVRGWMFTGFPWLGVGLLAEPRAARSRLSHRCWASTASRCWPR